MQKLPDLCLCVQVENSSVYVLFCFTDSRFMISALQIGLFSVPLVCMSKFIELGSMLPVVLTYYTYTTAYNCCRKENEVAIRRVFTKKDEAIAAAEVIRTKLADAQDDEEEDEAYSDNSDAEFYNVAPKAFYKHKDRRSKDLSWSGGRVAIQEVPLV